MGSIIPWGIVILCLLIRSFTGSTQWMPVIALQTLMIASANGVTETIFVSRIVRLFVGAIFLLRGPSATLRQEDTVAINGFFEEIIATAPPSRRMSLSSWGKIPWTYLRMKSHPRMRFAVRFLQTKNRTRSFSFPRSIFSCTTPSILSFRPFASRITG